MKSLFNLKDLPPPKYPEIAILGRSNAGKSSLINALLNQKRLARVSSTPGFTKAINFYLVDRKFYLVDLPGYGYAKVSKSLRLKWQELVEGYLRSIRDLRLLVLIFDIRRDPDELDLSLINFVNSFNKPYSIVLNKIDLCKKAELKKRREVYQKAFSSEQIFLISCQEKIGLKEIKVFISKFVC